MMRFLVLYDTPPDPEAFDRHYRDVHVPLAKQLPGLRRYTLSRGISAVRGGAAYHLVAELDWDDQESMQAAFASPEGKATARDLSELAPEGVRSVVFEVEDA